MTSTRPRTPTAAESPRWLDDEQQAAWRAFNGAMHKLRWALECQLQHDAGLSFLEYHALAALSENPGHTKRMSELAEVTNASLSRLSHLVKRLEQRNLVRREPDPTDGRYTNAILTPAGLRLLVASAPGPRSRSTSSPSGVFVIIVKPASAAFSNHGAQPLEVRND